MFFVGSIAALYTNLSLTHSLILGIILVAVPLSFCVVTYFAKGKNVWILFVVPAFLFAGFGMTKLKTSESIFPLYPYTQKEVQVYGTICSQPRTYGQTHQFLMEVHQIKCDDRLVSIKDKIKVSTQSPIPSMGKSICAAGKLNIIDPPKNSTSFDSKKYNQRQGVYFSLFAESISPCGEDFSLSLKNRSGLFITTCVNNYIDRFPSRISALLKGIILNNKSEIPDETTEMMLKIGTYRYIYCPYIHISIILYMLSIIFKDRRKKIHVCLCIIGLYLFMNISVPSAWRICLFLIISYLATRIFKIKDTKTTFYLTILITGILSPLTLSEPGFIISVLCAALMRCFAPTTGRLLYKVLHNRKLSQFLAALLIISVGIYPLCSFFGYNMTPWSFILGLILTPITSIIYAVFYFGLWLYILTGVFCTLGVEYLVSLVEMISTLAAKLPLASINTGSCSILFITAFYSILWCIYRIIKRRRCIPAEILSALVCFVLIATAIYGINDAEVTFLSVGNADCCIIRLPGKKTVMIDGGGSAPYTDYDIGKAEVLPYLSHKGINRIDAIVLSHYDKDHADGVITVMQNMPVEEIFIPDYLPKNSLRDIIENEAKNHNITINYITKPGKIHITDELDCNVLLCDTYGDSNDNSVVCKITYGQTSILFPGDISIFNEYKLTDTKADILKVPHHGSSTSSSVSFINKTDPQYSIISVGSNNPYGHPVPEVVDRYTKQGSRVLRTDICGDIHFIIGKSGIKRVYSFKEWFLNGG